MPFASGVREPRVCSWRSSLYLCIGGWPKCSGAFQDSLMLVQVSIWHANPCTQAFCSKFSSTVKTEQPLSCCRAHNRQLRVVNHTCGALGACPSPSMSRLIDLMICCLCSLLVTCKCVATQKTGVWRATAKLLTALYLLGLIAVKHRKCNLTTRSRLVKYLEVMLQSGAVVTHHSWEVQRLQHTTVSRIGCAALPAQAYAVLYSQPVQEAG